MGRYAWRMADLQPCPACRRHILSNVGECPFCGSTVRLEASPPLQRAGRLTRAAIFAGATALAATACGDPEVHEEEEIVEEEHSTGGETTVEVVQDGDGNTDGDSDQIEEVHHPDNVAMPYGAPPSRERLV